jgi:hypothetical protein
MLLTAVWAKEAGINVEAVILLGPGFNTGAWTSPFLPPTFTRDQPAMADLVESLTTQAVPVYIVDNGDTFIESHLVGTGASYAKDLATTNHVNVDNSPEVIGILEG